MVIFILLIGGLGWAIALMYDNYHIGYVTVGAVLIYALIQYFAAGKLAVAMMGAREIQKSDNPRLYRIVENLSITVGMQTPKVYMIIDPAPNAFATGRDPQHAVVGVTSGLLEIMDDRELTAVMAHEIGHVQNYDIRVSTIAFGLVSAIGLLADIALRALWYSGGNRNNNNNGIIMIYAFVAATVAFLIARIVQAAVSRQREYLADASGALTTRDPEGLASALAKLGQYGRPMKRESTSTANLFMSNPLQPGFFTKLFSSHPPLDKRIERLNKNSGTF
jgi:heat shock protein HtpX